MDLIEAMKTMGACRKYRSDPVPRELVVKVLDAARWAATGSNSQPLGFIVVENAEKRQALHDLYQPLWNVAMERYHAGEIRRGFTLEFLERIDRFARDIRSIPVLIVVCARVDDLPNYPGLDHVPVTLGSSIYPAVQNLMLAARNEGLGTVLTTLFVAAEPKLKELLEIPADFAPAAVVTLGWPAQPFPKRLKRRPLVEMAYLDTFGTVLPELV